MRNAIRPALLILLLLAGCSNNNYGFVDETVIPAGPSAPVDLLMVGMDTVRGMSPVYYDLVLTFEVANNTRDEQTIKGIFLSQNTSPDYETSASNADQKVLAANATVLYELRLRARHRDDSSIERRPPPRNARESMPSRVLVRLENGEQVQGVFEIPLPLGSF